MNTTILIIAAVLTGVVLIFLYSKKGKNTTTKIPADLASFASEHECTLTEFVHFRKILLGIDANARKFFFIRKSANGDARRMIDLTEIKECAALRTGRSIGEGKNVQSVIDRIDLAFTPKEKGKADIRVDVYNSDFDSLTLTNEIAFAGRWTEIVNTALDK